MFTPVSELFQIQKKDFPIYSRNTRDDIDGL